MMEILIMMMDVLQYAKYKLIILVDMAIKTLQVFVYIKDLLNITYSQL